VSAAIRKAMRLVGRKVIRLALTMDSGPPSWYAAAYCPTSRGGESGCGNDGDAEPMPSE
jgi:hypothetical protein